jgi:hypothetical protein
MEKMYMKIKGVSLFIAIFFKIGEVKCTKSKGEKTLKRKK